MKQFEKYTIKTNKYLPLEVKEKTIFLQRENCNQEILRKIKIKIFLVNNLPSVTYTVNIENVL